MSIFVGEKEKETKIYLNEGIIKSKEIICPKCGENCLMKFDDFKIKLFGCKNDHEVNDILLNDFNNTQNINENNIICNICNKNNRHKAYNKEFFICLNCKKNLCPLCKSIHNKQHKIIDYDKKNYVCTIHNDQFYSYCNECKLNLCLLCKLKHNKEHEIINYENIIPNEDEIKEEMNKFRQKIDKLSDDINKLIVFLQKISENMELYYKINYDLIVTYEIQKRNYQILKNINIIKDTIKNEDIDEIISNIEDN